LWFPMVCKFAAIKVINQRKTLTQLSKGCRMNKRKTIFKSKRILMTPKMRVMWILIHNNLRLH
jgi:hypothetical protein